MLDYDIVPTSTVLGGVLDRALQAISIARHFFAVSRQHLVANQAFRSVRFDLNGTVSGRLENMRHTHCIDAAVHVRDDVTVDDEIACSVSANHEGFLARLDHNVYTSSSAHR